LIIIPYLLFLAGGMIYRFRPFRVLPKPNHPYRKKVLEWIHAVPGKIDFATGGISVSALIPLCLGLAYGLLGQLFGPLVALLLSPVLVVCLDVPVMVAMATALAVNFAGMLTVAIAGGFVSIPLNLQILLWVFLGSVITFLGLSLRQKNKPYPVPVAAVLVLLTSVTLWALMNSQPGIDLLMQQFHLPLRLLGWFGGVQG